jgi:hypothetical protein
VCTVTIVPHGDGVRLACNRDEQRSRPGAVPPRLASAGRHLALFPVDPVGGGTWIGVNDAGLAVTLLNRTGSDGSGSRLLAPLGSHGSTFPQPLALAREPAVAVPQRIASRGTIVPQLLACGSLDEALEAAEAIDARRFAPFCVVAVQGHRIGAVESDGRSPLPRGGLDQPMLFTSSALGDEEVEAPRRWLFDQTMAGWAGNWLEGQARYHRHRWPDRPEISVWMERPDARTVSHTVIDVMRAGIRLRYEPVSTFSQPDTVPLCSCSFH